MVMKRPLAKGYGKKLMIEGIFEPGKRALIIEDVVTTGTSIAETVEVVLLSTKLFNMYLKI
jgi:uridine monophosphate synthetase